MSSDQRGDSIRTRAPSKGVVVLSNYPTGALSRPGIYYYYRPHRGIPDDFCYHKEVDQEVSALIRQGWNHVDGGPISTVAGMKAQLKVMCEVLTQDEQDYLYQRGINPITHKIGSTVVWGNRVAGLRLIQKVPELIASDLLVRLLGQMVHFNGTFRAAHTHIESALYNLQTARFLHEFSSYIMTDDRLTVYVKVTNTSDLLIPFVMDIRNGKLICTDLMSELSHFYEYGELDEQK